MPNDPVEVSVIMRALEPEVVDAVWAAVEALLPKRDDDHPLGCHRPRVPDRLCFLIVCGVKCREHSVPEKEGAMSKVTADISMSLDGFVTEPNPGGENPLGDDPGRLHDWMFDEKTATDIEIVDEIYASAERS